MFWMNTYFKNGFAFFLLLFFLYPSAAAADGLEAVIKFRRFGGGVGFPQGDDITFVVLTPRHGKK